MEMNLTILAAEIAKRIPEMSKDSIINNEAIIFKMLSDEYFTMTTKLEHANRELEMLEHDLFLEQNASRRSHKHRRED
jgi:hypothetical protein